VLGDRLAGVALGKDKPGAAMWSVLASIADAFNPLGEEAANMLSLVPSVFRPAAHIQTNKNWTGNPIYPTRDFEKNKPDSEQSFQSNSAVRQGCRARHQQGDRRQSVQVGLGRLAPGLD
jgi:hypothetical protein